MGNGKSRRYPRATVEALQDQVCRGIGASTSNGYLTAIKSFSRWLVETERIDRDRLVSLSRQNAQVDRRHERRALPEADLRKLLGAAGDSKAEFLGLTGGDRLMIYAAAMTTGYRASELASLWPGSFDLDAALPTATVKAAYSKNRRTSVQPLPVDMAEALRGYLAGKPADQPVWPGAWHKDAAEMLRLDLAAAGIPYRDADGRVADFHAPTLLHHPVGTEWHQPETGSGVGPSFRHSADHERLHPCPASRAGRRCRKFAAAAAGRAGVRGDSTSGDRDG